MSDGWITAEMVSGSVLVFDGTGRRIDGVIAYKESDDGLWIRVYLRNPGGNPGSDSYILGKRREALDPVTAEAFVAGGSVRPIKTI